MADGGMTGFTEPGGWNKGSNDETKITVWWVEVFMNSPNQT